MQGGLHGVPEAARLNGTVMTAKQYVMQVHLNLRQQCTVPG